MRKYYGEVANSENWEIRHRIIEVKANNVREAYKLISEKKEPDEDIYQISRDFNDCKSAQPVYDYFNGFSLRVDKLY
jgi:hypothetical protein